MVTVLCKNCAWFHTSILDPRVALCKNPAAKTSDVDFVFGHKTFYQCKPMRDSSKDCGTEGNWFKPLTEPRFKPAPNVQNSNPEM